MRRPLLPGSYTPKAAATLRARPTAYFRYSPSYQNFRQFLQVELGKKCRLGSQPAIALARYLARRVCGSAEVPQGLGVLALMNTLYSKPDRIHGVLSAHAGDTAQGCDHLKGMLMFEVAAAPNPADGHVVYVSYLCARGVGKQLMMLLMTVVSHFGCQYIVLRAVPGAYQWYRESIGFSRTQAQGLYSTLPNTRLTNLALPPEWLSPKGKQATPHHLPSRVVQGILTNWQATPGESEIFHEEASAMPASNRDFKQKLLADLAANGFLMARRLHNTPRRNWVAMFKPWAAHEHQWAADNMPWDNLNRLISPQGGFWPRLMHHVHSIGWPQSDLQD